MNSFLKEIIREKEDEIRNRFSKGYLSEIKSQIKDVSAPRPFKDAISNKRCRDISSAIRLIAEIKRSSPSRGVIRERLDVVEVAREYEEGGASAISVLTERNFFEGKVEYLSSVKKASSLPILQKDFIIDERQIYEGRVKGADAVLLIASILDKTQLNEYQELAYKVGICPLIEVHNEDDLEKALLTKSEVVGINNRDLNSFETSLNTTIRLIKDIPDEKIVISESGIKMRDDIIFLQENGVDAILVGETFMKSRDIKEKIMELLS
ncbi:MAG: indole-3-glycerol phosphate synthase TrpC [Nitrospirota bacterium]